MDLTALKAELASDPKGLGYAAMLPDCPGHVVEAINRVGSEKAVKPRFITARTILAECSPIGADILDRLEATSAQVSACKWAIKFLSLGSGLDVGNAVTMDMIDQLVAGGAIPKEHGDALKSLGMQPASRAEVLGLGQVTIENVIEALK